MKPTDDREFIPPPLFASVCNFAVREVMTVGVGVNRQFDYTISDCLQVAMLYPRNPANFRLPTESSLALLYNSYANLQAKLRKRQPVKIAGSGAFKPGCI